MQAEDDRRRTRETEEREFRQHTLEALRSIKDELHRINENLERH